MKLWETAGRGFPKRTGIWRTDFSAGRVLRTAALLEDENICDEIKLRAALSLLLRRPWSVAARLLPKKKGQELAQRLLGLLCGESLSEGTRERGERLISFSGDGPLIYAALLQSYDIDLLRDNVDWRLMPALIAGVSKSSRLYQVMEIRAMELPAVGTVSAEELDRLRRLKRACAIEGGQGLNSGLNRLFDTLAGAAAKS